MALPRPNFVERDPDKVVKEMIASWEADTNKTLYPAQVERLLVDLVAYRESLTRNAIQEAAEQNLVQFASYPMLDYLGDLVKNPRLLAVSAVTTLEFSLAAADTVDRLIPVGTLVTNGTIPFKTIEDATITAGNLTVQVGGEAVVAGTSGNGLAIGSINKLLDSSLTGISVTNTTATSGGIATESNGAYRERIIGAPDTFAVAGPGGAYKYLTKKVSPAIIDVGVTSPESGKVNVYPLLDTGLPDAAMLSKVLLALDDEKVRPLTDTVEVYAPTQVNYSVQGDLTVFKGADANKVLSTVITRLTEFGDLLKKTLGRDLIPEQWAERAHSVEGVYEFKVTSPVKTILQPGDWPVYSAINVTLVGTADE